MATPCFLPWGALGSIREPCTADALAGGAVAEARGRQQVTWHWVDPCPSVAPSLALHARAAFLPVCPPRAPRSSVAMLMPWAVKPATFQPPAFFTRRGKTRRRRRMKELDVSRHLHAFPCVSAAHPLPCKEETTATDPQRPG